jgi:hypothetical protein
MRSIILECDHKVHYDCIKKLEWVKKKLMFYALKFQINLKNIYNFRNAQFVLTNNNNHLYIAQRLNLIK